MKMTEQEMDNVSKNLFRYCRDNNAQFFEQAGEFHLGASETTSEERLLFLTLFKEVIDIPDQKIRFELAEFFGYIRRVGFKLKLDPKWGSRMEATPDWRDKEGKDWWKPTMDIFTNHAQYKNWLINTLRVLPSKAGISA